MASFGDYITRTDAAATLPVELAEDLVRGMAKASAALALGTKVEMSVLQHMIPSESTLPTAFWNVPDSTPASLAQTTSMNLSLNPITAYELDSIVVIPQNVIDDSQVPLWDVVRPRVAEAMAKKLDQAAIWGIDCPAGSNPSVLGFIAANSGGRLATGTTASGNAVVPDAGASAADVGLRAYGKGIPAGATVLSAVAGASFTLSANATAAGVTPVLLLPLNPAYIVQASVFDPAHDSAADVLQAASLVAQCSYNPSCAWVAPGWAYRNMAARTQQLIANPAGSDAMPLMLGGLPISPFAGSKAGQDGTSGVGPVWSPFADAIVGDWSALKVGVRKDITITLHTEGIISDSNGVVTYNLLQAGGCALKAVARYSWIVLQPPVADDSFIGQRSVFASVQNTGTAGRVGTAERPQGIQVPGTVPLPPTKAPAPAPATSGGSSGTAARRRS